MTLKPLGIIQSGTLRVGCEVVREEGRIVAIRPFRGMPDPFVLSVPFVNAHSHLEYRGLQGRLQGLEYWPWIRELTRMKSQQSAEEVQNDCLTAARENKRTGVGLIGEHADRPGAGAALAGAGIGGVIFQEAITFFERESPFEKLRIVAQKATENGKRFPGAVTPNPHSLYTVDPSTLKSFGRGHGLLSIHLAESTHERAFFEKGEGPIAEFYRSQNCDFEPSGLSPLETAIKLKLARRGTQFVHCCDLSSDDVRRLGGSKASVAHCPRSNIALSCPAAPIRELLRSGVDVGLGMDSAASSGPIDMFEEMRAALRLSETRAKPLTGDEVWDMATAMGARTLGKSKWDLQEGFEGPILAIQASNPLATRDVIDQGSPEAVHWIE